MKRPLGDCREPQQRVLEGKICSYVQLYCFDGHEATVLDLHQVVHDPPLSSVLGGSLRPPYLPFFCKVSISTSCTGHNHSTPKGATGGPAQPSRHTAYNSRLLYDVDMLHPSVVFDGSKIREYLERGAHIGIPALRENEHHPTKP